MSGKYGERYEGPVDLKLRTPDENVIRTVGDRSSTCFITETSLWAGGRTITAELHRGTRATASF